MEKGFIISGSWMDMAYLFTAFAASCDSRMQLGSGMLQRLLGHNPYISM